MFFTLSRSIIRHGYFSLAVLVCVTAAQANDDTPSQNAEKNVESVEYPQWPAHVRVNKEIIPPPPPGPYMSTALGDYSAPGSGFTRELNRPEMGFDSANVPMDVFSPDIPWPKNLRTPKSPNKWMPDNGYSYAPPHQPQRMSRQNNQAPSANNFNSVPRVNSNNTNAYRQPSMSFMSNNFNLQNLPGGYYQPRYQYPVKDFYRQPEVRVNRSPYPLSNKPRY